MKATELIKNLRELVNQYGDLELVSSIDDEGNGYNQIYFTPSPGRYEDSEFQSIPNIIENNKEYDDDEQVSTIPTHICIN